MNNYFIISIVASLLFVPALFADTTSTGTTATGTTATGTTATGTTATGTTATGTTKDCITGTGFQNNQATILLAQQAFAVELSRLVSEKQASYTVAMTLSGTTKIDALKAANLKFRTGFQTAIKTLNTSKKQNKINFFEVKNCKKEVRQEIKNEKKEIKETIKTKHKEMKNKINTTKSNRNDFNSSRSNREKGN